MRPIAILSAMEQEVSDLCEAVLGAGGSAHRGPAGRDYLTGTLWGVPVVIAWSRWGKVAATITTTHVLAAYRPSEVVFTGVAGSLDPSVRVGDIVVAESLVQHDMDASPLYPRHEVPLLGVSEFSGDPWVRDGLLAAARNFLSQDLGATVPDTVLAAFGIRSPAVRAGQITSGDSFVSGADAVADIRGRLPAALCVEMEGAAVAQVCHEHGVPFGIVRVVSDAADNNADVDFSAFLDRIAARYTYGVLRHYLHRRTPARP